MFWIFNSSSLVLCSVFLSSSSLICFYLKSMMIFLCVSVIVRPPPQFRPPSRDVPCLTLLFHNCSGRRRRAPDKPPWPISLSPSTPTPKRSRRCATRSDTRFSGKSFWNKYQRTAGLFFVWFVRSVIAPDELWWFCNRSASRTCRTSRPPDRSLRFSRGPWWNAPSCRSVGWKDKSTNVWTRSWHHANHLKILWHHDWCKGSGCNDAPQMDK